MVGELAGSQQTPAVYPGRTPNRVSQLSLSNYRKRREGKGFMVFCVPLDLLAAGLSGGLLLYSAWLLVPTAQTPLTDITYEPRSGSMTDTAHFFPVFPNDELPRAVEKYTNTGVGFEMLVVGTIVSVAATVLTNLSVTASVNGVAKVITVVVALAIGLGGCYMPHQWQRRERAERASWYAFLVWLKYHSYAKPMENLRVVVAQTAANSQFTRLACCKQKHASDDMDTCWEAVLEEVLRHARRRLVRRDTENLRRWANTIADSPRMVRSTPARY